MPETSPPASAVTDVEIVAILRRLLVGVVWTGAEIARRRVVLAALIDRLRAQSAER